MRVGSLNYATTQGLGILARDFYDNGIINEFMIVEHSSRKTFREWYPDSEAVTTKHLNTKKVHDFCKSVDVMFFFETPFNWQLINLCRQNGVKTILMPMYECMPKKLPATPDLIINPSHLDQQYYPQGVHIPIPVPNEIPWRCRQEAKHFVHNAGHFGLKGRNGTLELLEATEFIESPIKLTINSQTSQLSQLVKSLPHVKDDPRITINVGNQKWPDMWDNGDVLVFPEKFNGLSLPLQEARMAGMLIMATNRFPMDQWLPNECLIPTCGTRTSNISGAYNDFEEAIIDPKDIAKTIDEWYGQDITQYSQDGKEWTKTMSWEALKPRYMEQIECVLSM